MKQKEKMIYVRERRRRKIIISIFALLLIAALGIFIYSAINARITRVRHVVLNLEDLPDDMEGKKILYISDIDISGMTTPEGAANLVENLCKLNPDILILGGDYCKDIIKANEFFSMISNISVPMGKYAVLGENDAKDINTGNTMLLTDSAVKIGSGNFCLVGLNDCSNGTTNYGKISTMVKSTDCVIVVAHNPEAVGYIVTSESADNGSWADAVLSGHTHAGQMQIFGRTYMDLTLAQKKYLNGWYTENGTKILVSSGVGSDDINLRFGTHSEVWLITLKKK